MVDTKQALSELVVSLDAFTDALRQLGLSGQFSIELSVSDYQGLGLALNQTDWSINRTSSGIRPETTEVLGIKFKSTPNYKLHSFYGVLINE